MERVAPNALRAHSPGAWRSTRPAAMRFGLGLALLAAAAAFAFWPALRGEFLWDDHSEIVANAEIKAPGGLAKIWRGEGTLDYFPLKSTLQWVQWRWFGAEPLGYHVTNLALHVLGAVLVWRLLEKLGLRFGWLGGLVFAVHPLAVESVGWIAELKNVLSLPPLLLAALAFVDFDARRRGADYAAALGWFAAALLCKTTVAMFPCALVLFVWWRRRRIARADLAALAPFFGLALALGLVAIRFQHEHAIGAWRIEAGSVAERVGRAGPALWFYAGKMLAPFPLLPIYPRAAVDGPLWLQALAWLGLAALAGAGWRARATWGRGALLGLGWFVLHLLPVLGLVNMSFLYFAWVADHFAYLSLVAFAAGVAWLAGRAARSTLAPLVAAAAIFAGLARAHAAHFRTEERLWRYTLAHHPGAWLGYSNLAAVQLTRGEPQAALASARRALELKPDYASAHRNVAAALLHLGDLEGAEAALARADAVEPPAADHHATLALRLLGAGRIDAALRHAQTAVAARPNQANTRRIQALAFYFAGRPAEALPHYEAALQLAPDADTRANYGLALAALERWPEAIAQYEAALRDDPRAVSAHFNLGIALARTNRDADARREFERTLALEPRHAEAAFHLGEIARRAGDRAAALRAYRAAVQLRPDFPEARAQLAALEKESP